MAVGSGSNVRFDDQLISTVRDTGEERPSLCGTCGRCLSRRGRWLRRDITTTAKNARHKHEDAVDAQATASSARLGSICLQATRSSFTASTLTSKFLRACSSNAISTIRSTPSAPSTHGTPTYRSLTPYCPVKCAAQGSTRFLSFKKLSAIAMALVAGA